MLKLLHTSDVQLDAPFTFMGERGAQHRRQLRATFARIVALAQTRGYDMLLIAGDLFDDNHPSQRTVDFVREQLKNLDIPVVVLPGNHDCYDNHSIYRRETFPANVHIFTEQPTYLDFPELDLTVAGRPLTSRHDSQNPLQGIVRRDERRWFVALAHGNLQVGIVESIERPIRLDDIRATRADYVALGDWHSFADFSQNGVKAFYSGAPEPTSPDQKGAGCVASITLSDREVQVEKIRVGQITARTVDIDVSGRSESEVIGEIQKMGDPQLMIDVTLTGLKAVEQLLDIESMERSLASNFYWIRIRDKAAPELTPDDLANFPETHVIGQYIRLLAERAESATTERERRIAQQALQLGVALLQGKEVLR